LSINIITDFKRNYIYAVEWLLKKTHFMPISELALKLTDETHRTQCHAVGPIAYGLAYCTG